MGRAWAVAIVAALLPLCACKAELADGPADAAPQSDSHMGLLSDGPPDDTVAPLGPWGAAAKIPGADTAADEDDATLSSNELELYFKKSNGTDLDIYVMTRASTTAAFGAPVNVTLLNSASGEESPRLSPDDLTLYFGRAGDIYFATRPTVAMPWSAATLLASVSTTVYEKWLTVCSGNYFMISRLNGANGQDLYEGQLGSGPGNV